jgi:WD40 repeat protein
LSNIYPNGVLPKHDYLGSLVWNQNGLCLPARSADGKLQFWQLVDETTANLKLTQTDVSDISQLSKDGRVAICCDQTTGAINVCEVNGGRTLWRASPEELPDLFPQLADDGSLVLCTYPARQPRLWDIRTEPKEVILERNLATKTKVALSTDGRMLASCPTYETNMYLWDTETGKLRWIVATHQGVVTQVCFSPDNRVLATSSFDQTVRLWDAASGYELQTLTGFKGHFSGMAFSHDGRTLAVGAAGGIQLWNLLIGKEVLTLPEDPRWGGPMEFSPDDRFLVCTSAQNVRSLWFAERR